MYEVRAQVGSLRPQGQTQAVSVLSEQAVVEALPETAEKEKDGGVVFPMYGYYCSLCHKNHQMKSVVGKEHYSRCVSEQRRLDKLADEKRAREKPMSKSEQTKRLASAIFGNSKKARKGG